VDDGESGSIVLFVLFVCVAVAVLVQSLSAIILCSDRTLVQEASGRIGLEEKDEALATLRGRALSDWGPLPSLVVRETPEVRGEVVELPESGGWALVASAWHAPDVSPIVASAWIERARDGVDLPLAGLVAQTATWAPGRVTSWLMVDPAEGAVSAGSGGEPGPLALLQTIPEAPPLGGDVNIEAMPSSWALDEGWRSFFKRMAASGTETAETGQEGTEGLALTESAGALLGEPGTTVKIPQDWGVSPDALALLVVAGGASLDARDRGDVYGVLVVDEGDILLDGTRLHGALFATGSVDFGKDGTVLFSRSILRWATDQSLVRARLVPGSRRETIE
jgi:hypothetical protein